MHKSFIESLISKLRTIHYPFTKRFFFHQLKLKKLEQTEVVNSTKTNEKNSQQVKKNESSFAVKVSSLKIKFLSADSFEGYVSSWENLLWVLEMILFFQMLYSKSLENITKYSTLLWLFLFQNRTDSWCKFCSENSR